MADPKKCEHPACSCMVDDGTGYCSPQCETAAAQDIVAIECECAHSGCA